jgi:hypothetical protein
MGKQCKIVISTIVLILKDHKIRVHIWQTDLEFENSKLLAFWQKKKTTEKHFVL